MKNNMTPELLSCWPDGFSRYYSVSNILKLLFDESRAAILDVGGDSRWMAKFLDATKLEYDLTIVDTRKPDFATKKQKVHYVQADFFEMPLENTSYDAVINTDVLEHVPPELKMPFIERCIDVATSFAVFSAPQEDDDVTVSERQINEYYTSLVGKEQHWLKEHFEFGKPKPDDIERTIKKRGYSYICIDTNNLENWLMTFSANFINSELEGLEGMDELNQFYNQNILQVGDYAGKPYRKIYIVFKNANEFEAKHKKIESFFKPDNSKKLDFISLICNLFVTNYEKLSREHSQLSQESILVKKNLLQTQDAFVAVSRELDEIKASKAYRYATKLKSLSKKNGLEIN